MDQERVICILHTFNRFISTYNYALKKVLEFSVWVIILKFHQYLNHNSGTEIMMDRIVKLWLHFKPIYVFTKQYRMNKKYVQNGMFAIADEVLKEKEQQYNNKSIDEDDLDNVKDYEDDGIKKPQIFIDQLLKMKEHFTLSEVKDELNTILIAVR